MREPRSKQRFPDGGKQLYELLRQDYEPLWIHVVSEADHWEGGVVNVGRDKQRTVRSTTQFIREQRRNPGSVFLLSYIGSFDPMLYFWPVENQHVIVMRRRPMESEALRRLIKAMLRDGGALVQVMWPRASDHPFGDPDMIVQSFGPQVEDSAL